jgi:ketosteroid isomerase-like protein
VNEEQKILSTQKLLDVISKKNVDPESRKAAEAQWVRMNDTKARRRPLIYLFVGVLTGIIATGGIFFLLKSPGGTSAKSRTAEKIQAASSSASQQEAQRDTGAEKTVREAISRWKTAWEQKDINAYQAFYSPLFHTGKFDRRGWLDGKDKNFRKAGDISIDIRDLTISVEGRRAVATFVQHHKSPGLTDKGIKTLTWINENDDWKIVSERWKTLKK